MFRFHPHWYLSALLLLAQLAAAPALPAQTLPAPPQPPVAAPAQPALTPEELGDTLMAEQRYQAAIEAYKKGPRNSASLQNKLGIAYQMLLNIPDAMRCYQASLRLDPGNAKVMNNLGTIFDSQQQYGAAERMYRRALKLEPNSAVIQKNLGTALMAQHKYKKGADAYQAALAIDPQIFQHNANPVVDNPATSQERGAMNYYMARSCARVGLNERAIDYLRRAINEGFTNAQKIMADNGFAPLRGIPAFDQMIAAEQPH